MIIIINILAVLVCVLAYTTFNLLKKNEALEDAINVQQKYIDELNDTIMYCDKRLGEIDQKGFFKSDDEIGWFFEEVKDMSRRLKKFNTKE
jgi:uncharacterized protein YoxC